MLATALLLASTSCAKTDAPRWSIVAGGASYQMTSHGDAWSAAGADVTLTKVEGARDPWGSGGANFAASPFAGREVVFTGEVATSGGATNAAIWIRTDGASPFGRSFQTTQGSVVTEGAAPLAKSVRIYIPKRASRVAVGVVLDGPGEARFTHLRLAAADAEPSKVDAPALLDEAIALVRGRALAAEGMDWSAFRDEARAQMAHGDPAEAAYPAIRYAITKLHDGHSAFLDKAQANTMMTVDGTRFAPVVKLLQGGVGYVELPGMSGPSEARKRYADTVAGAIAHLAPSVTHGWIIDLRRDTGGSVPPMVAGVRALLGNEQVGVYRAPGKPDQPIYANQRLGFDVQPSLDLTESPVAVIVGPKTASAGEAVAVAFHGRPRTRSFGQSTYGQANANSVFPLADGSALVLKTAIDVDRHGEVFGKQVSPDESTDDDAAIAQASAWLVQQITFVR